MGNRAQRWERRQVRRERKRRWQLDRGEEEEETGRRKKKAISISRVGGENRKDKICKGLTEQNPGWPCLDKDWMKCVKLLILRVSEIFLYFFSNLGRSDRIHVGSRNRSNRNPSSQARPNPQPQSLRDRPPALQAQGINSQFPSPPLQTPNWLTKRSFNYNPFGFRTRVRLVLSLGSPSPWSSHGSSWERRRAGRGGTGRNGGFLNQQGEVKGMELVQARKTAPWNRIRRIWM